MAIASDVAPWSVYRDEVRALAARFRVAGGRAALLSNSGPEVVARVRADHPRQARFEAVSIFREVGRAKADPRIFRLCLEGLGPPAGAALLVDDRADKRRGRRAPRAAEPSVRGPDALERLETLVR